MAWSRSGRSSILLGLTAVAGCFAEPPVIALDYASTGQNLDDRGTTLGPPGSDTQASATQSSTGSSADPGDAGSTAAGESTSSGSSPITGSSTTEGTSAGTGDAASSSGTTSPSHCGNGSIDGDEECDGEALGNATCVSLVQVRGALSCASDCTYDTSRCGHFGNDGFYEGFAERPEVLPCEDLRESGTPTMLGDDDAELFALGFRFELYGVAFEDVVVSSDGTAHFGADEWLGYGAICLPGDEFSTPYLLAAYWNDLDPEASELAEVYVLSSGEAGDRRFAIQWEVAHWGSTATEDLLRIQAVFHEAGHIEVCYADTINGTSAADRQFNDGRLAIAGLQGPANVGLQYNTCETARPELAAPLLLSYRPLP